MWYKIPELSDEKRAFGLDLLRCFAIFFVMLLHGGKFVPKSLFKYYSYFFFDGVGIFFVLSGFLIGGIFIKQFSREGISFSGIKNFWLKRWTRTLPNYYFFLPIAFLVKTILGTAEPLNTLPYLTFTQNLTHHIKQDFFDWSWSLSVEEWFYLLLPILVTLLFFIVRDFKKAVFLTIILIIFGVTLMRFLQRDLVKYNDLGYSVFYRLDGIMFGVFGAFVRFYFPDFWSKNKNILLWFSVGLFFLWLLLWTFFQQFSISKILQFTIVSLIVFCLLPSLDGIRYSGKWKKPVVFVSLISYSLYLVNNIVQQIINYFAVKIIVAGSHFPLSILFIICYIAFWIISIGFAYLIYIFYEKRATVFLRKKLIK